MSGSNTPNDGAPLVSDDSFRNYAAVIGLTSSIVEEVDIGRGKFTSEYEEPFDTEEVVIQLTLDLNDLLKDVQPPINEQATGPDSDRGRVSFEEVCAFEQSVKGTWGTKQTVDSTVPTIFPQFKLFLAKFFDKHAELNNIFGTADSDFTTAPNASSLVYLDDVKIQDCLNWSTGDGCTYKEDQGPQYNEDGTFNFDTAVPKELLAANLLSTRQIVQVLEAFADLGTSGASSRMVENTSAPGYKYALRAGDSIIASTVITDEDDRNQMEDDTDLTPHSRKLKIQLVQSDAGAAAPAAL